MQAATRRRGKGDLFDDGGRRATPRAGSAPGGGTRSVKYVRQLTAFACCPKSAVRRRYREEAEPARDAGGEQPGDQEDPATSFVGPAGPAAYCALAVAATAPRRTVTNASHFWRSAWQRYGADPARCRRWNKACCLAERAPGGQPQVIVLLGATAAQALLGPSFRVTRERGRFIRSNLAPHVMATVHPSSLLRIENDAERKDAIRVFVRELRQVVAVLGNGTPPEQRQGPR
jgi:DNA polymerase